MQHINHPNPPSSRTAADMSRNPSHNPSPNPSPNASIVEPQPRPVHLMSKVQRHHRDRGTALPGGVLSASACEARLLARHAPLDAHIDDLHSAADLAPLYSTPGIRYRSTVTLEDIGEATLWSLDLESLKQCLATTLLLPWDQHPSIPGMYQQMLGPMSDAVRAALADIASIEDFTPAVITRLNQLIPHRRIEWIGPMRDLAQGDSVTARELRYRYFLETGALEATDPFADTPEMMQPIPADENERFLDFIRGYPVADAPASPRPVSRDA